MAHTSTSDDRDGTPVHDGDGYAEGPAYLWSALLSNGRTRRTVSFEGQAVFASRRANEACRNDEYVVQITNMACERPPNHPS